MNAEQREAKNARDRARRAAKKKNAEARATTNGGINPATKLPHTPTFLKG